MSKKQIKTLKKSAKSNKMHRCCADCNLFIWLPSTPYSEEEDMLPEDVVNYRYSEADLENPQIQKVKINGEECRSQEIELFFREAMKQGTKFSELFGELDLFHCYAPKSYWGEKRSVGALYSRTDEKRREIIVETDRDDCTGFLKYTEGKDLEIARGEVVADPEVSLEDDYVFRKDDERWYIEFENEVLKPENLDGFGFIHYLMQYNNKIIPKKLYQAVKGIKTSNIDEEDSVKTYTVNPREIEKAQLGELKEHHSNIDIRQFKNKLEKIDKGEIKKIAEGLRKTKEALVNKKDELVEDGRFSDADDIEKNINDTQQKIDIVTRLDHDSEHKQFYDLVYKAIEKAKEKIKKLSINNNYDSLLIWNHFKDSIVYKDFHYSYNPTTPISWKL